MKFLDHNDWNDEGGSTWTIVLGFILGFVIAFFLIHHFL